MHPRDGGEGGSGQDTTRTLYLAVLDVSPPAITGSLVAAVQLAQTVISCELPILTEAGFDFDANHDRIYLASPDEGAVRVLDAHTFTLLGDLIPVGEFPTDVEVEVVNGIERAFVSSQDGDSVSRFSLTSPEAVTTYPLDLDGIPNLMASALAITSDGTRLYVACPGGDKLVTLNPLTGGLGPPITNGASPRRVVVQRSPV